MNQFSETGELPAPKSYTIRVKGHLPPKWTEWFDGLTITPLTCGDTVISGITADQPALHGLLNVLRKFNLTLISVHLVGNGPLFQEEGKTNE